MIKFLVRANDCSRIALAVVVYTWLGAYVSRTVYLTLDTWMSWQ